MQPALMPGGQCSSGRPIERFPPQKDAQPLPESVTISTLERLSEDTTTDVQKAACAGVIDALTTRISKTVVEPDPNTATSGQAAGDDRTWSALTSYVDSSRGTAAASTVAEGLVYRNRVLKELLSLPRVDLTIRVKEMNSLDREDGYDAIVEVHGRRVIIEIKFAKGSDRVLVPTVKTLRDFLGRTHANTPILLISPSPPTLGAELADLGAVATQWRGPEDTPALRKDLLRASRFNHPT